MLSGKPSVSIVYGLEKIPAVRFQPLLPDKNISIVAHDIADCCTDVSWEIGRSKRVIVTTSELKKGCVLEFK